MILWWHSYSLRSVTLYLSFFSYPFLSISCGGRQWTLQYWWGMSNCKCCIEWWIQLQMHVFPCFTIIVMSFSSLSLTFLHMPSYYCACGDQLTIGLLPFLFIFSKIISRLSNLPKLKRMGQFWPSSVYSGDFSPFWDKAKKSVKNQVVPGCYWYGLGISY